MPNENNLFKNGELRINTTIYQATIYQAKNGAFIMLFGNKTLTIPKDLAEGIAYDMLSFDKEIFNLYYNKRTAEYLKISDVIKKADSMLPSVIGEKFKAEISKLAGGK